MTLALLLAAVQAYMPCIHAENDYQNVVFAESAVYVMQTRSGSLRKQARDLAAEADEIEKCEKARTALVDAVAKAEVKPATSAVTILPLHSTGTLTLPTEAK